MKHHRHELPIKLHAYSFGERQRIAERRRRQMSRLNRRGISRFRALKDRFLNRFSFLTYFAKRPSKAAKALEEGVDAAATLKPVSELLKPLSEYHRVELDRLDSRHFVLWRQDHQNVAGSLEIFDTSTPFLSFSSSRFFITIIAYIVLGLSSSQSIEFPPISTDLLVSAQFVCARGFIFLAVDPKLVFSNYSHQPMLEYVKNRIVGAAQAFPGLAEIKNAVENDPAKSRNLCALVLYFNCLFV